MSAPWLILANPHAGGGRRRRRVAEVAALVRAAGRPVDVHWCESTEEALSLLPRAIDTGLQRLIVSGGDGTLHRLLPILASSRLELALLPFGTSNDFARALDLPRRPQDLAQLLLNGRPRSLDLGRLGERFFATVATCGLDADISQAMLEGQLPFSGTLGYLYAALSRLPNYRPAQVRLTGDFGTWEGPAWAVAAGNTRSYGGGLKIAPQADPSDGRFDVCIVGDLPRRTALHLLPRLFYGGHLKHPAVQLLHSTWLKIETDAPRVVHADGEFIGRTPICMHLEQAALSLVLPPVP
ncbi:MAG: YegS/Rv2252/BmrU family lipid kinase [Candidatus Latescibacteria bacterium]|nr:YegS/Rv2252/BmrU family lipid kinase [Candidatus Latescibacterota bacterium]